MSTPSPAPQAPSAATTPAEIASEDQLSGLELVDHLKAVIGEHAQPLDQCLVHGVGDGAEVLGRLPAEHVDVDERHDDPFQRRTGATPVCGPGVRTGGSRVSVATIL